MPTALISRGVLQCPPQGFSVEGHLDVLRSRFWLGQQPTGFCTTAAGDLQAR